VPNMTVSGTTEEVIANLLEGTGMNYSISRADSGGSSKLTVLGQAPPGTEYARGPSDQQKGRTQAAPPAPASQLLQQMTQQEDVPKPESTEESARNEQAMRQMFGGASPNEGSGPNVASHANHGAIANDDGQAMNSKGSEYLPFPDEFGNPIRTTTPPGAPLNGTSFLHSGAPF